MLDWNLENRAMARFELKQERSMKCKNNVQLRAMVVWIQNACYATGSRVFGVETEDSDYDFVATEEEAKHFAESIGLDTDMVDCEKYGLRFMSLKYRKEQSDPYTNLIIVPDKIDFDAWVYATNEMISAGPRFCDPKWRRAWNFEALLAIHYTEVGQESRLEDLNPYVVGQINKKEQ